MTPRAEGTFASPNPAYHLPGAGVWVAGADGVTLGRFVWADATGMNSILSNSGAGKPEGFAVADLNDTMTRQFFLEFGMTIPGGYPVPSVILTGDVWVKNANASTPSAVGNKAYASNTTGQVRFAAAGSSIDGYTETKWYAATAGAAGALVIMTSEQIG